MPPFIPRILSRFTQGVVLNAESDAIADDALRVGRNLRLDREESAIVSRPGSTQLSGSALGGTIQWLGKLYGIATDYSYAQVGAVLSRLTDAWGSASTLSSAVGATPLTGAVFPSGADPVVPYAYFAGASGPVGKDNGSALTTWGIAPPTAAPSGVALAADLTTTINVCDATTGFVAANLASGPAADTTNKVEGTGSLTFTVAASTLGSLGVGSLGGGGGSLNLDTLSGGDATVKNDDYIHLQVRLDRPERLVYMQVDIDLDTQTYNDAFVANFYSAVVSGAAFTAGAGAWNTIQIRKSSFQRSGLNASLSWAVAKSIRLQFLTNSLGTLTVNIDDIKLRGGVGLEGDIEYTVCYRNSTTKGRGNPPKNSDGAVLWTTPFTTDRQRISVTLTNVAQGGANHPGDTQIDKLWLFRRGSFFDDGVRVVELDDTTTAYTDGISDSTLLLNVIPLETDNDPPPSGATVVFGPGGFNRLFYLLNGYLLGFTKAWERDENRAENCPELSVAGIGDGSQRAIAGIATDTQVYVWTESATYQVLGAGEDTFLPVPIPDSRGVVGQHAVTSGDGRVFFESQDGIYEMAGLQQRKLTSAIDPFFLGIAVDGNPARSTTVSTWTTHYLRWHADPIAPMLTLLYVDTAGLWKRLVLKKSRRTGEYTVCLFDDSTVAMHALLVDDEDNTLIGGGDDGHIYQLEDHSTNSDDGVAITSQVRTRSDDGGIIRQRKRVSQVVIEGTTNGATVTPAVYYDKGTASELLTTMTSTSPVTQTLLTLGDATAKWQDVAIDLSWSSTSKVIISSIGYYLTLVGPMMTFWDSDAVSTSYHTHWKWLEWDMEVPADIAVTYLVDEVVRFQTTIVATTGRRRALLAFPPQLRGKTHRVTLASATPFEVWGLWAWGKPLGSARGYQAQPLVAAVAA